MSNAIQTQPIPAQCKDILRYLTQRPDYVVPVDRIPEKLRVVSALAAVSALGFIEFGRRKHHWTGPTKALELHLEEGMEFTRLKSGRSKSVAQLLAEESPKDLPLHIRLTDEGHCAALAA